MSVAELTRTLAVSAALQFLTACRGTILLANPTVVQVTLRVSDTLQNVVMLLPAVTPEAIMFREAQPLYKPLVWFPKVTCSSIPFILITGSG